MLPVDFNNDGKKDILAAGNFYGVSPYEGRYDAGYRQVLIQDKKGWVTPSPLQSGLVINGDARDIKRCKTIHDQWLYLVARNNDSLLVIMPKMQ